MALTRAWDSHFAVDDQADPAGQHLVAHLARRHPNRDVVVPRFVAPSPGRIVVASGVDRGAPVGEVLDGWRHLLDELDRGAEGCPQPEGHVVDRLAHGGLDHLSEVGGHGRGVGDDVHAAEQTGRHLAQLAHHPVRSDPSAVALEPALGRLEGEVEVRLGLALVLAVGEQDGVMDRPRDGGEQLVGQCQPGSDGGATVGLEAPHGDLGLLSRRRRGGGQGPGRRVDLMGPLRPGDDSEGHPVPQAVDRRGGRLLGGAQLGRRVVHRARGVDDDDLGRGRGAERSSAARRGHRHHRVDLAAAFGKVLVLVGLGAEGRHELPFGSAGARSAITTVMLSWPPAERANSMSAWDKANGVASAGWPSIRPTSSAGVGA